MNLNLTQHITLSNLTDGLCDHFETVQDMLESFSNETKLDLDEILEIYALVTLVDGNLIRTMLKFKENVDN